jgi:hypothetical protein
VISVGEPVAHQLPVYRELLESAHDFFDGEWQALPVKVRIMPLLVGSTGGGKTFLVHRLAEELGIPLFKASITDWILIGASNRGAPPTVPRIYRFIDEHPRGIIFVDEAEKLGDEFMASDWRRFLALEVFGILDRAISPGVFDDAEGPKYLLTAEELQRRFRHSFFLVAAGAWQSLWSEIGRSVGFNVTHGRTAPPTHKDLAATLRLEVLNRFSSRVLLLPPFSAKDYRQIFSEVVTRLPPDIRSVLPEPDDGVIDEAVRSQKGFRFFEEIVATAIRSRRILKAVNKSAAEQQHANEDRIGCSI